MEFIQRILPANCWGSNPTKYADLVPSGIIDHYISAIDAHKIGLSNKDPFSVDVCIEILKHYRFSAHFLIDRLGNIYQLVPLNKQAWHAGESLLSGRDKCNQWCIGIEHISTGEPFGDEPAYPEPQVIASVSLHEHLAIKYGIKQKNTAGHDHVRDAARRAGILTKDGTTPAKKYDPGAHFPWERILEVVPV
jgi:N-acetyl-anhydromuramyl-L-alanine amidase AmpD